MPKKNITSIDYEQLIDQALHNIVKNALIIAQKHGLPGEHHFYITFRTKYPGVSISSKLLSRYPEEMTIVMQYQFEDLLVTEDLFSVTLSFGGIKEKLTIPFDALTSFADPSVRFGLQFRYDFAESELDLDDFDLEEEFLTGEKPKKKSSTKKTAKKEAIPADNIISLDSFRKK